MRWSICGWGIWSKSLVQPRYLVIANPDSKRWLLYARELAAFLLVAHLTGLELRDLGAQFCVRLLQAFDLDLELAAMLAHGEAIVTPVEAAELVHQVEGDRQHGEPEDPDEPAQPWTLHPDNQVRRFDGHVGARTSRKRGARLP